MTAAIARKISCLHLSDWWVKYCTSFNPNRVRNSISSKTFMFEISSLAMKQNAANACTSTSSATSAFFSISFCNHDAHWRSSSFTDCLCSSKLPCSDIAVPATVAYFTFLPVLICCLQRQQNIPSPSLNTSHHTLLLQQKTMSSSIQSCLKTWGFDGNCLLISLEDTDLQLFFAHSIWWCKTWAHYHEKLLPECIGAAFLKYQRV